MSTVLSAPARYAASMSGVIYDAKGRCLAQGDNGLGYLRVRVGGRYQMVHRLVWNAYNGEIPHGMQVDHIDGNKHNNDLTNLRLLTPSGNTAAYHSKRAASGKKHHNGLRKALDKQTAKWVKAALGAGAPRITLAKALGVSRSCIRHIHNGLNHADA